MADIQVMIFACRYGGGYTASSIDLEKSFPLDYVFLGSTVVNFKPIDVDWSKIDEQQKQAQIDALKPEN